MNDTAFTAKDAKNTEVSIEAPPKRGEFFVTSSVTFFVPIAVKKILDDANAPEEAKNTKVSIQPPPYPLSSLCPLR